MTRVNTVPVKELADQWLMAEYREITHVFALMRSATSKWDISFIQNKIPSNYTFNKGHVSFFYDKLAFIEKRYFDIKEELLHRNFNLTPKDEKIMQYRNDIPACWYNDWVPSNNDHKINVGRLIIRLQQRPDWYRFSSKKVQDEEYLELLEGYLK